MTKKNLKPEISSEHFRIVSPKKQLGALRDRLVDAGEIFFDIKRAGKRSFANKLLTQEKKSLAQKNAQKNKSKIHAVKLGKSSGRSVITSRSAQFGNPIKPFTTTSYVCNDSSELKTNSFMGKTTGNQLVYNIGPYNSGKPNDNSVLNILNYISSFKISDENIIKEKEKNIARLIADSVADKMVFSFEQLVKINPNLSSLSKEDKATLHKRMKAICYLFGVLEIARRPAYNDSKGYLKSNPKKRTALSRECCSAAYLMTMELLIAGEIRFKDVFGENATYGYITGKKLRYQTEKFFEHTLVKINDKFVQWSAPELMKLAKKMDKKLIISREAYHLLGKKFLEKPGVNETPSKPYLTPINNNKRKDMGEDKNSISGSEICKKLSFI